MGPGRSGPRQNRRDSRSSGRLCRWFALARLLKGQKCRFWNTPVARDFDRRKFAALNHAPDGLWMNRQSARRLVYRKQLDVGHAGNFNRKSCSSQVTSAHSNNVKLGSKTLGNSAKTARKPEILSVKVSTLTLSKWRLLQPDTTPEGSASSAPKSME